MCSNFVSNLLCDLRQFSFPLCAFMTVWGILNEAIYKATSRIKSIAYTTLSKHTPIIAGNLTSV